MILGGGRQYFYPNDVPDPEYSDKFGRREDGRNLIDQWLTQHEQEGSTAEYVWNKADFDAVDPKSVDFLLGKRHRPKILKGTMP